MIAVLPETDVVCAGHCEHVELPALVAYLPISQFVQTDMPVVEYLPASQFVHTDEPVVD